MQKHIIRVDSSKCVGCGLCRKDCPENNIAISGKKAVISTQDCMKCGHCVAVCPKAAISMTGYQEKPQELKGVMHLEPEQLLNALRTRRSIRHFKKQVIEPEILNQIIEAGRVTPTAKNAQDVSYIVLGEKKGQMERIAVSFFRKLMPLASLVYPAAKRVAIDDDFFFKKAPSAIVILSKNEIDGSLAASNMALMAEAYGLGVLYSGFFTMAANHCGSLRRALGIKKNRAVTTLVLGYPNITYHRTPQREAAVVKCL